MSLSSGPLRARVHDERAVAAMAGTVESGMSYDDLERDQGRQQVWGLRTPLSAVHKQTW